MVDQLIDESVSKPSWKFWAALLVAASLIGAGLSWGYSYLFPHQRTSLALSGLSNPAPTLSVRLPTSTQEGVTSNEASPSARLVTTKDSVGGFQVSHPSNWSVQSQDSFVLLRSDECGSIAALMYPLQILGEQTPTDLLVSMATAFLGELRDGNQGLTLGKLSKEDESGATALFGGSICGNQVSGSAQLTTQGSRALLKLSWYPANLSDELTNTMTQVLQSYKSIPSNATYAYQGTHFALPVPDGYLFKETESSGSIHTGDRLFQLGRLDFAADQTLDVALDAWLEQEKSAGRELQNLTILSTNEQSGDDGDLRRYNAKTRLLTYQKGGATFRGALTAAYTDALGNSALILWRTAPQAQWSLSEPTLLLATQGAIYQATDGAPPLQVPVYATWKDASALTGTAIRTTLASNGSQRWQSVLLRAIPLLDSSGNRYLASVGSVSTSTGEYSIVKDGQPLSLEPLKDVSSE